jgi:hypothetical protein
MCARTLCSRLSVLTILISYWEVSQMDTNSNNFISLRVSRRATNNMVMIGLVGALAVAGLSVATGERSRKGDRLQVAPKHTSTVASTVVTTLSQPPIGCEPVFSGLADPKRSHVFGRCIS